LVSSFAMAGQTVNGVTTFGNRVLLKAGATDYHGDDEILAGLTGDPEVSRWGDYSATSVDPSDPNRFWTIQMYPSNSDVWSTQITELITVPQLVLSINKAGANVAISWPNVTGYHLTAATNVIAATWTNVTQTAV